MNIFHVSHLGMRALYTQTQPTFRGWCHDPYLSCFVEEDFPTEANEKEGHSQESLGSNPSLLGAQGPVS